MCVAPNGEGGTDTGLVSVEMGKILNGGNGNDTFVLAATEGTDIVLDFKDGSDRLGLAGGLSFGQLSKAQSGVNTRIKITTSKKSWPL